MCGNIVLYNTSLYVNGKDDFYTFQNVIRQFFIIQTISENLLNDLRQFEKERLPLLIKGGISIRAVSGLTSCISLTRRYFAP